MKNNNILELSQQPDDLRTGTTILLVSLLSDLIHYITESNITFFLSSTVAIMAIIYYFVMIRKNWKK